MPACLYVKRQKRNSVFVAIFMCHVHVYIWIIACPHKMTSTKVHTTAYAAQRTHDNIHTNTYRLPLPITPFLHTQTHNTHETVVPPQPSPRSAGITLSPNGTPRSPNSVWQRPKSPRSASKSPQKSVISSPPPRSITPNGRDSVTRSSQSTAPNMAGSPSPNLIGNPNPNPAGSRNPNPSPNLRELPKNQATSSPSLPFAVLPRRQATLIPGGNSSADAPMSFTANSSTKNPSVENSAKPSNDGEHNAASDKPEAASNVPKRSSENSSPGAIPVPRIISPPTREGQAAAPTVTHISVPRVLHATPIHTSDSTGAVFPPPKEPVSINLGQLPPSSEGAKAGQSIDVIIPSPRRRVPLNKINASAAAGQSDLETFTSPRRRLPPPKTSLTPAQTTSISDTKSPPVGGHRTRRSIAQEEEEDEPSSKHPSSTSMPFVLPVAARPSPPKMAYDPNKYYVPSPNEKGPPAGTPPSVKAPTHVPLGTRPHSSHDINSIRNVDLNSSDEFSPRSRKSGGNARFGESMLTLKVSPRPIRAGNSASNTTPSPSSYRPPPGNQHAMGSPQMRSSNIENNNLVQRGLPMASNGPNHNNNRSNANVHLDHEPRIQARGQSGGPEKPPKVFTVFSDEMEMPAGRNVGNRDGADPHHSSTRTYESNSRTYELQRPRGGEYTQQLSPPPSMIARHDSKGSSPSMRSNHNSYNHGSSGPSRPPDYITLESTDNAYDESMSFEEEKIRLHTEYNARVGSIYSGSPVPGSSSNTGIYSSGYLTDRSKGSTGSPRVRFRADVVSPPRRQNPARSANSSNNNSHNRVNADYHVFNDAPARTTGPYIPLAANPFPLNQTQTGRVPLRIQEQEQRLPPRRYSGPSFVNGVRNRDDYEV